MTKHGYAVNLAILFGVAMSGVLLPAGDAFGCKWFKVCGYTPGDPVPAVDSTVPGCIAVNDQSLAIGADGCVRFRLCIAPFVLVCLGCPADLDITLTQPGLPPRILKARCTTCGFPVPTVPGCVADICAAAGDTSATAINVTACVLSPNQEVCAEGFPAFLTSSDAAAGDEFGGSVSISGDVALIGAQFDDDNGDASGSAYVFRRIGTAWIQEAKLTASDGAVGDHFGFSVSISGDVALIGAQFDDDNGDASGSAYVFRRIGTAWIQEAKLTASDGAAFDEFGSSVSISGEVAVVGASKDGNTGPFNFDGSGSAYVFRRIGTSWIEEAKLTASDGTGGDLFGSSVSINGDVALIGADQAGPFGSTGPGSAYVFVKPPGGWVNMTQTAKLTASDGVASEQFGSSVSISGDVLVVGAIGGNGIVPVSGSAYVYRWNGSVWVQQAKLTASDGAGGDRFGVSVSISGEAAVVGASRDDDACPGDPLCNSGSAYVFVKPPAGWVSFMTETAKLTALGGAVDDWFGFSVAIDGATAVVGARFDDHEAGGNAGSAFIFTGAGGPDCNANEVPDGCDILNGVSPDCNANWVPDACDVAGGFSLDCNANEIPDECEVVFAFVAESLQLSPIGNGFPQSLTIPNALPAASDVTLSFAARGDFGAAGEFVDVDINGVAVGSVFVTSAGDCTVPYDIDEIVISAATYNSALKGGPDALITMVASAVVDPDPILCGSFIALTVQYQAIPPTDANANGIPDSCDLFSCPSDFDLSGEVNVTDLLLLLGAWGPNPGHVADINGDGSVNVTDLLTLLAAWGPCP